MKYIKLNSSILNSVVRQGERRRYWLAVCLLIAAAASAICFQLRTVRGPRPADKLQGAAAIERLKQDGHYESLQTAMNQARFGVSRSAHSLLGRDAWHAPNAAAGYDAYVTADGVGIFISEDAYLRLSLRGIGYGNALRSVAPGAVSGDAQSINIARDGVQEWFVNGQNGLEHGFTLAQPPGRRIGKVPLRLALHVSDGWRAAGGEDGKQVVLRNDAGQAIEYGKLTVTDQLGQNIPARLTVADEQVVIEVEDGAAQYPLTIDPLFTLQQRLTAADGAPGDFFGYSLALDGNTAVIGAPYDDDTRGSAYIFVRSGATWTQQTRLTANDGALNDYFGWSVAIKGNTALVGTLYGPGNADADQGAAYVFVRSGVTWTLQKKLIADDGQAFAQFGTAVALDGDTALIGAPTYTRTSSVVGTGAAYVFVRNGTTWTQQKQLLAADGEAGDNFGIAVALEGDTALIGAPDNALTVGGQGAAYIFTRTGTNWTQQPLLTTSPAVSDANFGNAVALSGENALIGAYRYGSDDRGAVYSYRRFAKNWSLTGQFSAPNPAADAHFGASVALSGDTAVVGAALDFFQSGPDQQSAYAFVYSGTWNYVRQFSLNPSLESNGFGRAVALSGDTVLVGAYRERINNHPFPNQGAAYTFVLSDSRHLEQSPRLSSIGGGPNEYFGEALALDGDTLVIGAYAQTVGGNAEQGAVYVFVRNGTGWSFQSKLTANDGAAGDSFGWAVALSGETLVVGAYRDDIDGKTDQGSAYLFTRSGTTWTQQQKLSTVGTDSSAFDNVGYAVAVSGQTVAVGARGREIGRGAVYVYVSAGAVWTQQQKLSANDGKAGDSFGSSVALSGNTLATGTPQAKIGLNYSQGAAYVFTRTGTLWTQQQKLITNDGAQNDAFGAAIALDGDAVAVGAPKNGNGQFNTPGAAYVFERINNTWLQQPKLSASDGIGQNTFGNAVALKGSLLVVGARGNDNGVNVNQGAAYVFTRVSNWFEQQKLTTGEGAEVDNLGASVAISGEAVVVGAPYRNIGVNGSKGAAYTFTSPRCPAIAVAPATVSLPDGSPGVTYNQPLTASGGGVGEYHFAVTRGSLPPGIVVLGDQGLGGTPTAPGTYRFTITATYLFSLCTGSREYTITILPCPAVTISPATLPQGVLGKPYSRTLTASGIPAPHYFEVSTGVLPPGLTLTLSGVLSGTPTQAGSYSFTVTGGASGCLNSQSYTLIILPSCPTFGISPATLPSGNVGAPYNQPITVTGGAEPYLFAIKVAVGSGNPLPPGINLNQGSFVGTPTQTGTYTITMVVWDANECETTKTYSITINPGCPPLILNPPELASGTIDVPYLEFFTLTGGIGTRLFSVTSGSLPPGLTLTLAGALSGTPRGVGGFNFTVTAVAGGCSIQRPYTLVINCPTITITPTTLPGGTAGAAYSQQLTVTGGTAPQNIAVTLGALPSGLSLSASGLLSGTPTASGVFNFDVTATDANGCTGGRRYTLTIGCPTITINPATLPIGNVGQSYSQTLTASGGTGPYQFVLVGGTLPAGLSLAANGTLSGTPTVVSTSVFTVRATDAKGCTGTSQLSLRTNAPPGISTTGLNVRQGDPTVQLQIAAVSELGESVTGVTITVNGGASATVNGVTLSGLTINSTGIVRANVAVTCVAADAGFTLTATDPAGATGTTTLNVAVTANPAPTLSYNNQSVTAGGALQLNPLTGLSDNGSIVSLTVQNAGTFTGTLNVNSTTGVVSVSNAQPAGSHTITIRATDNCGATRDASFTLGVGCPVINITPATLPVGTVGTVYNQTLTAAGGATPYSFNVSAGALPPGLSLSAAGQLTGTPTASGPAPFTIKATDANGCEGISQYTLTINALCPTITVNPSNAALPAGQAGVQYNQSFTQIGGAGTVTFTITAGALPNGLSLATGGALTGTPTAFGDFNFTVKATDANGCTGARAYSLHLNAPCPAITINPASLPNGTVGTAYNQTTTATGGGAPYAYSIGAGALPDGVTLASGGAITGTPNAAGTFNFTVKATDANGCTGTRAYAVTINPAAVNPGLQFYPLPKPLRLLDTRAGQLGCDAPGAQIPGNTSRTQLARRTCDGISIPANAKAVTGNITTVQSGGGFLTLYPSDAAQPLVANSNYAANEVINNVFAVGLGNADGAFKIFVTSNTDVVVDITGYYAPPSANGLYFHPLPKPIRLLETRAGFSGAFTPGAKLQANVDTPQQARTTYDGVTIPNTALAIVGNATTLNGGAGFFTLYPGGVARPLAASSNFGAGQVMNAPFTVGLSATGEFNIFTMTSLDMVLDVLGYYSTEATDANGAGLLFNPLPAPVRLLETRAGLTGCYTPGVPLLNGSTRNQQARGACSGQTIANNALAIVGNATVVNDQAGYLTFWPNGAAQPLVASSNFEAGQILNRHFTTGLGADGAFKIFSSGTTDLVIDVAGFFAP